MVNGASSGSALLRTTNAAKYHWDDATNSCGPILTAFAAKEAASVAAGQPATSAVFWAQGDGEAFAFRSGACNVTKYRNGLIAMWNDLYTNICPNAPIIVILPGANDNLTNGRGMAAVKMATLQAIEATPYAHLGPQMFDLPRPFDGDQVHLLRSGYWTLGYRMARA